MKLTTECNPCFSPMRPVHKCHTLITSYMSGICATRVISGLCLCVCMGGGGVLCSLVGQNRHDLTKQTSLLDAFSCQTRSNNRQSKALKPAPLTHAAVCGSSPLVLFYVLMVNKHAITVIFHYLCFSSGCFFSSYSFSSPEVGELTPIRHPRSDVRSTQTHNA